MSPRTQLLEGGGVLLGVGVVSNVAFSSLHFAVGGGEGGRAIRYAVDVNVAGAHGIHAWSHLCSGGGGRFEFKFGGQLEDGGAKVG